MKPVKLALRFWIAITAVVSFLGGWVMLSHSGKPASLFTSSSSASNGDSIAPLPTLEPIPGLNTSQQSSGLQPLPQIPQIQQAFPRLRTGGS